MEPEHAAGVSGEVRTTCLWAATVVALATPARADDLPTIDSVHPPTIRVTAPDDNSTVERIAVDVHARAVSWVILEVTVSRFGRGLVPIDLPAGSRIVGMAVTTPDERSWSAALPKRDAVAPARIERPFDTRFSRLPRWSGDKMMIRRRMKLSRERITSCYEHVAQWRYRPELDGQVMLQFEIGANGKVETATATSAFPAEINTCLENVLEEWEFPLLDTVVRVNYPLTFSTGNY